MIRDAGDAFAASMSRAQFDRMRFIFGLSDRGEASGGANESDDEREGRGDAAMSAGVVVFCFLETFVDR